MMGRTALFVSLGTFALGAVHASLASIERQQITFHPIRSPLVALARPTMVLLPFYGFARIATVMSALAQVLALKMRPEFDAFTSEFSEYGSLSWNECRYQTEFNQPAMSNFSMQEDMLK